MCGVRDIRDYRIRSSTGEVIAGGSPFNVAAKSLRMGDFSEAETRALMAAAWRYRKTAGLKVQVTCLPAPEARDPCLAGR